MSLIEERVDAPAAREPRRQGETIWRLVERQARAHPERTAVVDGETEISYRQVLERASSIAGELAARRVEPGSLVGVCVGRSWELVATLVGVLRAGCAYVPLDPAYPRERVRYMLEHSGAACVIVDRDEAAELCTPSAEGAASESKAAPGAKAPELLRLHQVGEWTADGVPAPSATDLAYVLYTSGSTGRPKGVAIEHRSVVSLVKTLRTLLDDDERTGVLAAASICFDASVLEIFGTLALGGTIVLAENVLALLELPAADRVRMCVMVPSSMQALLAAGRLPAGIRCVALGGEVLKRSLVEQLHALDPAPRVVNVYGPTEDTVFSTTREIVPGAETITIGTSVEDSRSYVLDEAMRPVPSGVAGELYLAGEQLARGYLHEEELTRERFVTVDPSGPVPETRLYRTGDACRRTAEGEIEFLGRLDQQVKIRGYRIELEEIESALETLAGVDGAAAAVFDGVGGQPTLVAYLVSQDPTITGETARAHLEERLPGYMVPRIVERLEALPRLPSGKLDRKSLPAPAALAGPASRGVVGAGETPEPAGETPEAAGQTPENRAAELPRAEQHAALLAIIRAEIASILGLGEGESVPVDVSLYDLGLDSLTTVELGSRLGAILERTLPVSVVVERSTPAALADFLLDSLAGSASARRPVAECAAGAVESGPGTSGRGTSGPAGVANMLGSLQTQLQSCYPPFLAAKAPAWTASDKGAFVRELKSLVGHSSRDPFSKLVRTGSAHRGTVADTQTGEEREALIWTTNLYLGLNRDPDVIAEARSALERFGTGMGTSAAAAGVTDLHLEFERSFAELVGKPSACLFPTGYTANVGAVAGIVGAGDVVVLDQLCHASIVDGARLSGAKIRTFRHNDPADLESVLVSEASPYRTIMVALEGVYSMGEGAAPVAEIVRTAKKHHALVLVDEAHSFGFYGPRGAGLCAARGVTEQVDFIMTTLSKALGSLGGVVAASEEHVALMKASARAFIFQASTSPASMAAALAALRRLSTDDSLRDRLWDTTAYMRKRFAEAGYDLGTGDGPIVTPHFPDKEKLFAIVSGLFQRGVCTSAVTYPIVETGRGRLRFICSAAHSRADVDKTLEALIDAEKEADERLQTAAARQAEGGEPVHAEVARWAEGFSAFLETAVAGATGPVPSLAVSIELPGGQPPITIEVDGPGATVYGPKSRSRSTADLPSCSLRLLHERAASALCSTEAQALLASVLDGECVLHGEVEPFVWWIARMVEHQRQAAA